MKHHSTYSTRSFLMGVLVTLLVISLVTPALAAAGKMIEVFGGIKIYIDDVELNPKDAAGNPVDVFVYNGTTYLPVRAVSEALGKPVQWDGKTQSVYIGKHSSDTPAAYLSEMDYFALSYRWDFDRLTTDNLGNNHTHSIEIGNNAPSGHKVVYKLNGQYSRLTAWYYQEYSYRGTNQSRTKTLVISGDGKELWQGTVAAGIEPQYIDIDITGVLELTIEYPESNSNGYVSETALGDVALWT